MLIKFNLDVKYFLLNIFIFTITTCYSQGKNNSFLVQGKFSGHHIKAITFSYNDSDSGYIKKTCKITNQQFSFSGSVNEPSIVYVIGSIDSHSVDDKNYAEFFIESGSISIFLREDHFKEIKIWGSKTQDQNNKLDESKVNIRKILNPYDSLSSAYSKILDEIPENDTAQYNSIAKKRLSVIEESKKYSSQAMLIDRHFISSHPDSFLSSYLLYLQFHSQKLKLDSARVYFNNLSPTIQKSYWGKELDRRLGLLAIGESFPNIKGMNVGNAKLATLVPSKAGYTLVVIWASWCVPCRENMPQLIKMFNKYHNKGLKIIAITADNSKQNWLAAIKKDKLFAWQHILPEQNSGIMHVLGLYGIPAEILLNRGTIIGKYSGADNGNSGIDDLEKKLDQIFNTN